MQPFSALAAAQIAYDGRMVSHRASESFETLHLGLELLKRIPRQRKVSAPQLHAELHAAGYARDLRSIQRQLDALCRHFDIERDTSSKPYGYRWKDGAAGLSLPSLTEQESLLLCLAEQNLRNQLPASLMKALDGFFVQARRNLSPMQVGVPAARAREWLHKVRVVSATLPMLPPKIRPGVFDHVSQALYNNLWLEVSYQNAERKRTTAKVMPLGLAQQGGRLFMACRFEGHADVRNLALHRIQNAQCTTLRFTRPPDFDLQRYDADGRFSFGVGVKIRVCLWIADHVALLLGETPLATDQQIQPTSSQQGGHELTATLADSSLLVWWIRSHGPDVQVLSPSSLARRI